MKSCGFLLGMEFLSGLLLSSKYGHMPSGGESWYCASSATCGFVCAHCWFYKFYKTDIGLSLLKLSF